MGGSASALSVIVLHGHALALPAVIKTCDSCHHGDLRWQPNRRAWCCDYVSPATKTRAELPCWFGIVISSLLEDQDGEMDIWLKRRGSVDKFELSEYGLDLIIAGRWVDDTWITAAAAGIEWRRRNPGCTPEEVEA